MSSSATSDLFFRYKKENKLEDKHTILECFKLFDKNRDNLLDIHEFEKFLNSLFSFNNKPYFIPQKKVKSIYERFNTKKNKAIDFSEFEILWQKLVLQTLCPKSAFILVDVQNDFISGSMSLVECPAKQDGAEIVPCINSLIEKTPFDVIAYTFDWHPEDHCSFIENVNKRKIAKYSPTKEDFKKHDIVIYDEYPDIEQKLWPAHCIQGSFGSQLHPDLTVIDETTDPLKRSVVNAYKGIKSNIDSYSAFFDNCKLNETTLNSDLKKHGITEVYVCGLAGDVCVAATSNDALDLGYRVVFVEDACRGITEEDIEIQKKKLASRHAVIANSKQVLNMVLGKDRRPELAYLSLKIED